MQLSELIQDSKNANKGSKRGRQLVGESLKRFGAGRSVLVDRDGRLIAGNKTAEQASAAGITEVIIVKTDGTQLVAVQRTDLSLDDQKAQELAIADNRAGQIGLEWDKDVLAELVGVGDMDLQPFFTDEELADTIGLEQEGNGSEVPAPAPPVDAITKPGDLIILGDHRLLCGDGTSRADVERLMDGSLAEMVWTDPPYNVKVASRIGTKGVSSAEASARGAKGIMNDSMEDGEFRIFLVNAFLAALQSTTEGGAIYVAHADLEGENFRAALRESGWGFRQNLVWVKNSLVLGRQDYQWMHEPILYGWKPGAAHRWFSDRKQTTVLNFDRPARSEDHPTMKPTALVEYCIRNSSSRGDRVLDLFGGSGTTLMACEQSVRRAYLMELDPCYCDVIVKRWETLTGRTAVRP